MIPQYPSVEGMVAYVDRVVVGKVLRVEQFPERPEQCVAVVVEPTEVLKGERASEPVTIPGNRSLDAALLRLQPATELLVFLKEHARQGLIPIGEFGGAVMVNEGVGFYDLSRRHDHTYDLRLERLVGRDQILAAVRRAVEWERRHPQEKLPENVWPWVSLPVASSGVQVLAPMDSRMEQVAEEWERSEDPRWRLMAIRAAQRLDTKRARAVIERLLNDPAYAVEPMQWWDPRIEWRTRRIYFVRQAAWDALGAGRRGLHPVLEGPDEGRYSRPTRTAWVLIAAGAIGLLGIAAWTGRRRRSLGVAVAVLCLELLAVVLWLGWRGGGRMDSLSFAAGGTEHELVSHGWRLWWLRVNDSADGRGVMVWSEGMKTSWDVPWFLPWLTTEVRREKVGVAISSGKTMTAGAGVAAYPFHLLQTSYLWILGVLGAWPVVFGVRGLLRGLRKRLRVATGKCGECGYDVRWGAGVCPECGAAVGGAQRVKQNE